MKEALRVLSSVYTVVVPVRVFVRRNKKANLPLLMVFLLISIITQLKWSENKVCRTTATSAMI